MQKSGTLHLNESWKIAYRVLPDSAVSLVTSEMTFRRTNNAAIIASDRYPHIPMDFLLKPVHYAVSCHVLTSQVVAWQNGDQGDPVRMMTRYQQSEAADYGRIDRYFELEISVPNWFEVIGRYPSENEVAEYRAGLVNQPEASEFGGADVAYFRLQVDGRTWQIVDNIYHFHFSTFLGHCAFGTFKEAVSAYRIEDGRWMQGYQGHGGDLDFQRLAQVEFE